jgi:RES domain-containing protein
MASVKCTPPVAGTPKGIPSSTPVIAVERNVLLNPRHPEAQRLRVSSDEAFTFDTRLL